MLNWPLISNPWNWITVLAMLIIAGAFYHLLEQNFAPRAATTEG